MPSSALLFPGQGSHAEGMEEPYRSHPLLERGLELLGYDPFERLAEGTRYQQPALFLCSVAAWDAWRAEPPDEDAGEALADRLGLVVANDNAPGQLVLSGPLEALDAAEEAARDEAGARARRLDVTGAFHSPLMEPAAERLRAALDATPVHELQIPVYSNGSASPFVDVRRELAENLLRPVRWRETLLALRTARIERFVELGPGAVLTGLVKRTLQAA